ncbi:MAG TPA: hypothetical protein VK447_18100 [Myxococcaceae bacterium]|nr:hypothetical protein [Myxococcaceae bacterium]
MSRKRKKASSGGLPPSGLAAEHPPTPNAASPAGPPPSAPAEAARAQGPVRTALQLWLSAYRTEVVLFAVSFAVLASFSSQRFLRQSEAPHFVYQARGWLEGRLDLDPQVLPNLEDWACVRVVAGDKVRCAGAALPSDRWYVSFPPFPALLMLPFVALHGYQLNDTSFTVFIGALAIAFFYSLLRFLSRASESGRDDRENVVLALMLGFGTLFFYCAIRGEVWFSAEVLGVGLTCLYARNAVGARRPMLAGVFYSMAVLTRTPLLFSGLFFLMECFCPGPTGRLEQLKAALAGTQREGWRKLLRFAAGAAPLALLAAWYNQARFGSVSEFGHRFLFNNRVNSDIDQFGLFHPAYLARNLEAAFLKLPRVSLSPLRLDYDPHGLTLLLTLPILVLLLVPRERRRLMLPLWLTVAVTALPGLFYQNTGYMQFGFRFSLDYTPYLLLLFAISGWSLRDRLVQGLVGLGVLVNFWGAVAFRGFTELMRRW